MANSNRKVDWLVLGSGVKGPQELVTSGQYIGTQRAAVSFGVYFNLDGSAGSGIPAVTTAGAITAYQGPPGTSNSRSPLMGGSPAGTFMIEGSSNDVYYTDLGVTVSSLFGVSSSGIRLINLTGALPDYVRLRYRNTANSGIFSISFSDSGYGAGS